MAYDEDLAHRIRALLADEAAVTETRMFGGLAFLVGGNMAVAASREGGVLVRIDPATSQRLVATTAAYPMEMRGRSLAGWLRVDADHVRTKRQLSSWVTRGVSYASSLPAKAPKKLATKKTATKKPATKKTAKTATKTKAKAT